MANNAITLGLVAAVALTSGALITHHLQRSSEHKLVANNVNPNMPDAVAASTERTYTAFTAGDEVIDPPKLEPIIDKFSQIQKWLAKRQFQLASGYIDEHYSELSSSELSQIKQLFLDGEPNLDKLLAASSLFDELDVWEALASAAIEQRNWNVGFKALLRASELENSSTQLEEKLASLVRVTSHLRAGLERVGDEIGIKDIYQRAYDLHPTYPRFQLELAYAQLRIGDETAAKQLLAPLLYDPELGEIASQTLARIESQQPEPSQEPTAASNIQGNDIVVPLQRLGNSFFVNTSINNRSTRLLLDTGASITALSSNLISRLNLEPTGQTIQLSTANGQTSAQLYRTQKLRLGRLQLSGLVVAEIELSQGERFDGLLGTDALNQINSDYSYLIDNEENALIFRRR